MIKEAMEFVMSKASGARFMEALKADEKITKVFGSNEYLFGAQGSRIEERRLISPDLNHEFGTVEALTTYMKDLAKSDKFPCLEELAVIKVDSDGIRAELDEGSIDRKDVLHVPFFHGDLPPNKVISYDELILYLDRMEGSVQDEEQIRAALKAVQIVATHGAKVIDQGASTRIETSSNEDIQGANAVTLPKYLTIELRIGTREFTQMHRFRLAARSDGRDGVEFKLSRINRDGAMELFVEECIAKLRENLGDKARIYEGPYAPTVDNRLW